MDLLAPFLVVNYSHRRRALLLLVCKIGVYYCIIFTIDFQKQTTAPNTIPEHRKSSRRSLDILERVRRKSKSLNKVAAHSFHILEKRSELSILHLLDSYRFRTVCQRKCPLPSAPRERECAEDECCVYAN